MIDYGCGSGILALAALKLGAQHAYAVDIDEQALLATQQNAASNHITDETLTVGHPSILAEPVDTLMANIFASPLLSPCKENFWKPDSSNAFDCTWNTLKLVTCID